MLKNSYLLLADNITTEKRQSIAGIINKIDIINKTISPIIYQ